MSLRFLLPLLSVHRFRCLFLVDSHSLLIARRDVISVNPAVPPRAPAPGLSALITLARTCPVCAKHLLLDPEGLPPYFEGKLESSQDFKAHSQGALAALVPWSSTRHSLPSRVTHSSRMSQRKNNGNVTKVTWSVQQPFL